jgi:hypothetical protein
MEIQSPDEEFQVQKRDFWFEKDGQVFYKWSCELNMRLLKKD